MFVDTAWRVRAPNQPRFVPPRRLFAPLICAIVAGWQFLTALTVAAVLLVRGEISRLRLADALKPAKTCFDRAPLSEPPAGFPGQPHQICFH